MLKSNLVAMTGLFVVLSQSFPAFGLDEQTKLSQPEAKRFVQNKLLTKGLMLASADEPNLLPAKTVEQSNAAGDETATSSTKAENSSSGNSFTGAAVKSAGFLTGCVVGMPIAMVHAAATDLKRGTSQITGNSKNPVLVGLVGTALLPFSAMSGLVQCPVLGVENAWKGKPFSKDSFSLGEDFQ